jgi:hypothetical protein
MDEGRATGPVLVIGGSGTFRHEGRGLTSEIGRLLGGAPFPLVTRLGR